MVIPFSPPDIREEDIDAVVRVLRSGWITTGPVVAEFEGELAAFAGVERVVTLNSCTAALELALRVLGVGPGDEVVVPAYTYSASAAVVAHVGADLVLVDTAEGMFVPGVDQLLNAVTPRTKALIIVDIAGVPFDALTLRNQLAGRGNPAGNHVLEALGRPAVISDGAHSLGAVRSGIRAGGLGDFTAFSFHAVKNLTTAEGGALTWRHDLPVDHEDLARTVRRLSLHGQTKDALAKSQAGAWEYDILEPGYKANMPDILAALGLSQLRRYPTLLTRRREIARQYRDALRGIVETLEHEGEDFSSSAHLMLADLGEAAHLRERIIAELAAAGIASNVHYKPLPMLSAYRARGFDIDAYPSSRRQYERVLSLPLHTLMTDADVDEVAGALRRAVAGYSA